MVSAAMFTLLNNSESMAVFLFEVTMKAYQREQKILSMQVISYKRFREFGQKHAACRDALDAWFRVATSANWSNLVEVQAVFPLAEAVGNFTVFNIKGKRYRLIVGIDYQGRLIAIKDVLTHADYDSEQWKHDPCV